MRHKLTDKNEELRTAICSVCGPVTMKYKGSNPKGGKKWSCNTFYRERREASLKPYRAFVKPKCETCGFEGERCQMDVHHVDEDHSNNDPSNLMTLCANCHRLVHG